MHLVKHELICLALATCASVSCAGANDRGPRPARASDEPSDHGPVVVSIVVDQFAAWIADERLPLLPKDGGFARLLREGTYVREIHYAHAVTDTAPGHAALYTGAPPRGSGIFGNEVLRDRARVSILKSDRAQLVDTNGQRTGGSSAALLLVDGVGDKLRDAFRDAVIVSASLKDRGAIIPGGHHPTSAIWFDVQGDTFVTSSAFADHFPAWASAHGVTDVARWRAADWTPLDRAWIAEHAKTADEQEGEGDLGGLGTTFPHSSAHASIPALAWRGTPAADEAIFAIGLAAIDAYGDARGQRPKSGDPERADNDDDGYGVRTRPTLIALSLSANDYIGHTFGPDSWESWDELARLDAALARFFAALDAKLGPDGYAVILSADHGTTTMPEAARIPATRPWCSTNAGANDHWQRACGPVGRVLLDPLDLEVRDAAARVLGGTNDAWIAGIADPYVYFTPSADALAPDRRALLVNAVTHTLLAHAEIDRVIDVRTLPSSCPPAADESLPALVCRSYDPGRGGALYVVLKRGSFFDPNVVVGKGTSHGTHYLYDRAVPLIVRAPGRVQPGRVIESPLPFGAFAHTLASLLGIEAPGAALDAPDLTR